MARIGRVRVPCDDTAPGAAQVPSVPLAVQPAPAVRGLGKGACPVSPAIPLPGHVGRWAACGGGGQPHADGSCAGRGAAPLVNARRGHRSHHALHSALQANGAAGERSCGAGSRAGLQGRAAPRAGRKRMQACVRFISSWCCACTCQVSDNFLACKNVEQATG